MRTLTFLALLGAFLGLATTAAADTIPYQVQVHWTSGALAGTTSTGGGTYDDTGLTGTGEEWVNHALNALTFGIVIDGTSFDATDDPDYDDYPWLRLTDGLPSGFDFFFPGGYANWILTGDAYYMGSEAHYLGSEGFATYSQGTPVPEPASVVLLGSAFGLMAARRRRRR